MSYTASQMTVLHGFPGDCLKRLGGMPRLPPGGTRIGQAGRERARERVGEREARERGERERQQVTSPRTLFEPSYAPAYALRAKGGGGVRVYLTDQRESARIISKRGRPATPHISNKFSNKTLQVPNTFRSHVFRFPGLAKSFQPHNGLQRDFLNNLEVDTP